jgi:crossover junction endodeoxyribonuclease RusA
MVAGSRRLVSITVVVTFPPSVNGLFSGKARRFRSPRYEAWLEEAGWQLAAQEVDSLGSSPARLFIRLGRPDKRIRDLDNYLKGPIDLIVKHGILDDDSQIEEIRACWAKDVIGCEITVEEIT